MNFLKTLFLMLLAVFLMAGAVHATPVDTTNMELDELQGVFTGIYSSLDVNDDESQSEVFAFQSSGATATYVATVSYAFEINFGLYDVNNIGTTIALFEGSRYTMTPGDDVQIYIDYDAAGNTITTYTMDGGSQTIIDTATFSSSQFGFYIAGSYNGYVMYYSESDLNGTLNDVDGDEIGDNDHFLTYMGPGDMVDIDGDPGTDPLNDFAHWYIAAECGDYAPFGSSMAPDFTDMVIQVESMQPAPVPEPATLLLLGSGLLGFAGLRRKKKA